MVKDLAMVESVVLMVIEVMEEETCLVAEMADVVAGLVADVAAEMVVVAAVVGKVVDLAGQAWLHLERRLHLVMSKLRMINPPYSLSDNLASGIRWGSAKLQGARDEMEDDLFSVCKEMEKQEKEFIYGGPVLLELFSL